MKILYLRGFSNSLGRLSDEEKSFVTLTPAANTIELFWRKFSYRLSSARLDHFTAASIIFVFFNMV
jgi:hypothetical protein